MGLMCFQDVGLCEGYPKDFTAHEGHGGSWVCSISEELHTVFFSGPRLMLTSIFVAKHLGSRQRTFTLKLKLLMSLDAFEL